MKGDEGVKIAEYRADLLLLVSRRDGHVHLFQRFRTHPHHLDAVRRPCLLIVKGRRLRQGREKVWISRMRERETVVMNGNVAATAPCDRLADILDVLARASNDELSGMGIAQRAGKLGTEVREGLFGPCAIARVYLAIVNAGYAVLGVVVCREALPTTECPHIPQLTLFPRWSRSIWISAWEQRKLGDCGNAYGGLSGKTKEDFGHGEARFVPYTNVFDNPITDANRLEAVEIDIKQNEVRRGDALFTVSSETPEEVGMSSVWLSDQRNVYLNSFCFGYRQDGSFDPNYLAYMLRSANVRADLTLLAQGISRFNISKNKVMELEVPCPTIDEQRQVGSFLRQLDNLITLHQREPRFADTG